MTPDDDFIEIGDTSSDDEAAVGETSSTTHNCVQPTLQPNGNDCLSDDDSGNSTCTICLDPWTASGPHRIVALKCGHLFGRSCIEKWINRTKKPVKAKCPTCNATAKRSDLRNLYIKNVVVLDSTDRDKVKELIKQLDASKAQIGRLELKLKVSEGMNDHLNKEVAKLREEKKELELRLCDMSSVPQIESGKSKVDQKVDAPSWSLFVHKYLSTNKSCTRAITFDTARSLLLLPLQNTLSDPASIIKALLSDPSVSEIIPNVHEKSIKDMHRSDIFHRDYLLTTSLDKTAALVNTQANVVATRFNLDSPGWSCTFSSSSPHYVHIGVANNVIQTFDVRFPSSAVGHLTHPNMGPTQGRAIHTLLSTESQLWNVNLGGVSVWHEQPKNNTTSDLAWDNCQKRYEPSNLSLTALAFDSVSMNSILTFRGTETWHWAGKLNDLKSTVEVQEKFTKFKGRGKTTQLGKNCMFTDSWGSWFATGCEEMETLDIYEVKEFGDAITTTIQESLPLRVENGPPSYLHNSSSSKRAILDVRYASTGKNGESFLGAVSGSEVWIWKR